MKKAFFLMAC